MSIQAYAENGTFAPRKMVAMLRTTSDELARTLGCGFRIDAARHSEEFPPGIPN